MNFCKKIDGEYFCIAKNRKQQMHCVAGQIDQHDDACQYDEGGICRIGDLIEMDQKTLDKEVI